MFFIQFLVEGKRSPLNLGGLGRGHCAPPSERRVCSFHLLDIVEYETSATEFRQQNIFYHICLLGIKLL